MQRSVKPGKVVIEAVLRVAKAAGADEVLDYAAQAGKDEKVVEFRDQIELTVTDHRSSVR